ncbi:MAG: T9SS type A sorting domain-containing protein [Bacteroidales bacterium]|nr:T9SS type A sorting domain-containing protein [Bacteroidales bacterium]
MKNRIILLFLLVCPFLAKAEQGLTIVPLNGAEQTTLLSRIGKLRFHSDSLYLYAPDGTLLGESYVLDIKQIVFADVSTALDNTAAFSLRVYPNPAMDCLFLEGAEDADVARIFSIDGRLMEAVPLTDGSAAISVGNLPEGTWLLQVNTSLIKFIKQ